MNRSQHLLEKTQLRHFKTKYVRLYSYSTLRLKQAYIATTTLYSNPPSKLWYQNQQNFFSTEKVKKKLSSLQKKTFLVPLIKMVDDIFILLLNYNLLRKKICFVSCLSKNRTHLKANSIFLLSPYFSSLN